MKKALLVVTVLVLSFAMNANAQTFSEDFTGLTIGALSGQSSWTKAGTGLDLSVANSTPLTYPGYNNGGNEYVTMPTPTSSSSREYKGFGPITTYTTNTFFYSVLVKINTAAGAGTNYFLTLGNSGAGTTYFARLFAIPAGSGFSFGISKLSNTPVLESTERTFGVTYLVVVRYTFATSSANDDECFIWINPTGSSEPSTGAANASIVSASALADAVPSTPNDVGNFAWHIRGVNNPTGAFDGVRVGTGSTSALAWTNLNPGSLPVELTSFTAITKGNGVELAWRTATELNNYGFEVERSEKGNGSWNKVGFVEGHGTTNAPQSYSFVDPSANGTVVYRLKQLDRDGQFEYSGQVEVSVAAPQEFALMQNHPNPFNPTTSISYTLPAASRVSLKVYDMLGKEVAVLVNGMQDAGAKIAQFDASQLPSGIYFYTLRTNTFNATKKMLLVK